ncbi:hypothetical protein HID58_078079 [Brassica napus]|uniref:Uncharacterized protein n=1 Tax=Brassica napus TaxID=3708 RepID=A0ABQ7YSH1_BRANA|nr:hypothetical protein HID58_078079 [Brassica napus]
MDSDMVEIAPPAFAWCSKTLEIHKGFSGDECSSALKREVWKLILLRLDLVCNLFSSWPQLLSWLRQGSAAAPKTMRTVVAQAAIFLLWRQRNNVLYNQQSIKVISLFRVINQKCVTGFLFFFLLRVLLCFVLASCFFFIFAMEFS